MFAGVEGNVGVNKVTELFSTQRAITQNSHTPYDVCFAPVRVCNHAR